MENENGKNSYISTQTLIYGKHNIVNFTENS